MSEIEVGDIVIVDWDGEFFVIYWVIFVVLGMSDG